MGWLWSSGAAAPKGTATETSTRNASTVIETRSPPSRVDATESNTSGDPEIAKFLAQIQAEFGSTTSPKPTSTPEPKPTNQSPPSQSSSSSSSSWWSSWSSSAAQQPSSSPTFSPSTAPHSTSSPQHEDLPPRLDPLSESLLPTTMSCRQAFDHAFHCNSLGGQWTSVYRSGTVRSCSEQWDDFWFCMRTRAYSGTMKEEAIKDYYRQKELKKYGPGMPNSTDIWEPRTEKLPPGTAFQGRYTKPDISDEEWRRLEIERRRMIQESLRQGEEGRLV
ncbi:hypothetical protein F5Y08DRAFT_271731 [Xylaria arbuscula]|uniref:Early meiotic induction protein 1 n=1 Tax=Xylaria arbuscula TaxID=114810 RepID=A0A9W8NFA5_9PEZI|nr:hypothetical protein F5Y08DRAFT_271731 [Xylaria arbuscula]KAJ3573058.1 hypothetical protein NPX13_g4841 [Xylaria arbuscula]